MKVQHHLILICAACVLAGCPRQEPTLDEAIDALTDDWGERYKIGASYSNNYAVLKRVIAVTNAGERIRLTWKLYNHFRRTPEWCVEHQDGGFEKRRRLSFLYSCSWELRSSPNYTLETIIEGRKMDAETLRNLAEILWLTEPEWPDRGQKRHETNEFTRYEEFMRRLWVHRRKMCSNLTPEQKSEIKYAEDVRAQWYNYFRYDFSVNDDYYGFPNNMKPAFIEQLKRDFFIYSDVTNAYMWKHFPPELKEAFREVQEQMKAKKYQGVTKECPRQE